MIKLGECLTIKHGWAFKGEFFAESGEQSILTPGNFYEAGGFKYNDERERYYTGEYPHEYLCKKGDLIVAMTEQAAGLLGSTAIVPKDNRYLHNQRIGLITCDEKHITKMFAYYLFMTKSVREQISRTSSGTKVKHTSPEKIYDVEVSLPDIPTQKKIAHFLWTIDCKIRNNIQINDNLQHQLKLLYDYWFTQFDFPDENGKPYRASGGAMVWNEQLRKELPKDWSVTTVGDITVCHDSKRIPVSNVEREKMKGNIPYYGATGIMGYVNRAIFSGDYVLLAEDGSVMDKNGNPIIQRVSGDVWINNHAHVLQPTGKYSCRLLMMILKDIPVTNIKTGSIQLKINQKNLNSYKILNIPNNIIEKINQVFIPIDQQLIAIQKEVEYLSALRDWLLPMLMNGQATISD